MIRESQLTCKTYLKVPKEDGFLCVVLALLINSLLIDDLIRFITGSEQIVTYCKVVLYSLVAICSYLQLLRTGAVCKAFFSFVLVLIITSILSVVVCPSVVVYHPYYVSILLVRIIPAGLLITNLSRKKTELFFVFIKSFRFLWIVYAIVGAFVVSHSGDQYSMMLGYNLLFPVSICEYFAWRNNGKKWWFYSFCLMLVIVLFGSRGALLCNFVFVLLMFLFSSRRGENSHVGQKILLLLALFFLFLILFKPVVSGLASFFPHSRTLSLLANDISFDSGRSELRRVYLDEIKREPFRFRGFFSDRDYYSYVMGLLPSITNYPHSFFIEILFQLGFPLAFFLTIFLLVKTIKGFVLLMKNKGQVESLCLFLIFFVAGVVKLFMSDSYLVCVDFYIYLFYLFYLQKEMEGENNASTLLHA